jgi:hypothetical protein
MVDRTRAERFTADEESKARARAKEEVIQIVSIDWRTIRPRPAELAVPGENWRF